MSRGTTTERLARIETILEESVAKRINEMADDIKAIKADLDADKAELKELKHKGSGILIGVAIAASALGASASTFLKWIAGLFH